MFGGFRISITYGILGGEEGLSYSGVYKGDHM